MADQEILAGGVNEVIRVGMTVRRPTGPWTPFVHGLLRHLRERGFTAAPQAHGMTDDGLEVLSFLPGEVSNYPLTPAAASPTALRTAAQLLRRYHDASLGYDIEDPSGLMLPPRTPAEVICHGDFAPYNCVLQGENVVGIIDFDTAHPGPRVWDVAYAVYRWAPVTAPGNSDGFGTVTEQAERARTFCDHYGLPPEDRARLMDTVVVRLESLVTGMRARADAGDAAFARHIADGHDLLYLNDAAYVREHQTDLERIVSA